MATITKQPNGSFKITVSHGYDNEGKRIRRYMTYTPEPNMTKKQAEKEAERQAFLFAEQIRKGTYRSGHIRLSEYSEQWFTDYAEKALKLNTVSHYRILQQRVLHSLGHIFLDEINPTMLNDFYNELEKSGIRLDTKYRCKIELKAYLKEKKLTKVKLSEMSGVSVNTLDAITNGKNVNHSTVEKLCSALTEQEKTLFEPSGASKPLSAKTIRDYHVFISSMLETAFKWLLIPSNPANAATPPKLAKYEPDYLETDEVNALFEALDTDERVDIKHRAMIYTLVFCGMRKGELLGLKWSDIDFENKRMNISRSINYLKDVGTVEGETKTSSSNRLISVPETVISLLKEYKSYQAKERLKCGDKWQDNNYVFPSDFGKAQNPSSIYQWFIKFCERNNLKKINIHGLRHTNATLLIANGTPVTTTSHRLGHANTATTTKIYAHALKSCDEAAAETLNSLFPRKTATS